MKAICQTCGREYPLSAQGPPGNCVSCGGQLKRVPEEPRDSPPPAAAASAQEGVIELAGESADAGITCPNCGKWIEAGAQICTACGYSRRLARTLTTRVGTPDMLKPRSRAASAPSPDVPEIEAEKKYRRAKARQRIGKGDAIRLLVALACLLALSALVMAAPTNWLEENVPLKLPGLLSPPKFDSLNASLLMLMFLVVAAPIAGLGVRIGAAMTNIEINKHFSLLRTAGVLSAVLLTLEIVFTVDQTILHWQMPLRIIPLAAAAGLTLLLFTWYLHDVSFSAAIVLSLVTLIGAAAGLLAAAAAFAWVGNRLGIDPVIKPVNTWTWPK